MCSRRNKPIFQAVVFLGLLSSLGYFVYLYNTMTLKLERTDRQLKKYIQHQQSLSSQLQVVYEHRALLEKTYEKEKTDHKKTKQVLDIARRHFTINITRTKHETLNRFNSLETQHRMVKAQHEQLQLEHSRLQQQHARLSAEHQTVNSQNVNSFNAMKNQKEHEIQGLEAQINTLKKQVGTWKAQYGTQQEESHYYKNLHGEQGKELEKNKAIILDLYERINKLQRQLAFQQSQARQQVQHPKTKPPAQHPDRRHNVGIADARPDRIARVTKATVSTIKSNTIHSEDVDAKQPGDTGEETEDKDSENDEKGQQASDAKTPAPTPRPNTKQKYGVRPDIANRIRHNAEHGGRARDESRGNNEPPVILQATHREPTVKSMQGESEGGEESEQQKVQNYLSQNVNALQQHLQQQQLYQQRQQQHHQQKQQQQQGRYQHQQQGQEQQQPRKYQQQLQQQQQQHQSEDHSQDSVKKSDLSRSEQLKDFKKTLHEGLSKLKEKVQANSQKSSLDLRSRDTANAARDSRKQTAEAKRQEQFRRPIPRPGGRVEKKTGGESEKVAESRDSDVKKAGGGGDAPEEAENADDDADDEENENDERDNTINQDQEHNKQNPGAVNKSPDNPERGRGGRGLRRAR